VPAHVDHTLDERYQATDSPRIYRSDLQQSSIEARGSRSLAIDKDLIFPSQHSTLYIIPLNAKSDSLTLRAPSPILCTHISLQMRIFGKPFARRIFEQDSTHRTADRTLTRREE